jgi:hypothetical protein
MRKVKEELTKPEIEPIAEEWVTPAAKEIKPKESIVQAWTNVKVRERG